MLFAIDRDGTLVPCFETGDSIEWVGSRINTLLWQFTEYTKDDGTPNGYYEFYNQYSGQVETKELATAALVTACSQLEKFGWYSGYYCNTNYLKRHFNERDLVHFTRWLANWSSIKPDISCGIWQKAGDVTIHEVAGKVDLNECYVDFPTTIKELGLNGFKQHEESITETFFGKSVTIFKDGTWRYN